MTVLWENKSDLVYVLNVEPQIDCSSYEKWCFHDGVAVYFDLYKIREDLCGSGQPEKLFGERLTDEVKGLVMKYRSVT